MHLDSCAVLNWGSSEIGSEIGFVKVKSELIKTYFVKQMATLIATADLFRKKKINIVSFILQNYKSE